MSNFSFDDLWRKDFLRGFTLWIVIEVFSFLILPGIGAIQPGDRLKYWFSLSIPLGIGGAFLLGGSSRFVAVMNERAASSSKTLLSLLGQFGGSIGLAGIIFPFVMVAGEFLAKIFVE
ncbi:MAG: hypothetical protein RBJ76_03925 [Stenomitos frigidus ULC029]